MMKKLGLMVLVVMLIALTGCNTTQLSYWHKSQEANKWEAVEIQQAGELKLHISGEEIVVNYTAKGYAETKQLNAHLEMTIEVQGDKQPIAFEMYMKDGEVYINRGYFEQLYRVFGQKIPAVFEQIDAQYIGIAESSEQVAAILKELGLLGEDNQVVETNKMAELYEEIATLIGLDIEIVKEGDTYTIELDGAELAKHTKNILDTTMKNLYEISTLAETLTSELPYTTEDVAMLQAAYEESRSEIHDTIDTMQQLIQPTLLIQSTFKEASQEDKIVLTAQMEPMFNLYVAIEQKTSKTDLREVVLPESRILISQEDLMNVLEIQIMVIDPKVALEHNGKTYVPARDVLEYLGIPVEYNAVEKYAYATIANQEVKVSEYVKNGVSYITLDTLEQSGILVSQGEDYISFQY